MPPLHNSILPMPCRNDTGGWPEQEQHSASVVPQWTHLVLLAVVLLSIVYLFFGRKTKVFLKPQEWQDLPLVAKEVLPQWDLLPCMLACMAERSCAGQLVSTLVCTALLAQMHCTRKQPILLRHVCRWCHTMYGASDLHCRPGTWCWGCRLAPTSA